MKNNVGIYLKLVDFDQMCEDGISSGRDFFINLGINMTKIDTLEMLTGDSIYSARRWGPQKNEPDEVQKYHYQCKCGTNSGNDSIGVLCHNCAVPVGKKHFGLDIMGWIPLPQPMLTPIGAYMLSKVIGNAPTKAKKDAGKKTRTGKSKWGKLKSGQAPFHKDDMVTLYDRFEVIIREHVKSKKKAKFLLSNKDKLFTSKFPVISRRLRRFTIVNNGDVKQVQADEISTSYTDIISAIETLRLLNTPEVYRKTMSSLVDKIEFIYKRLEYHLAADKYKVLKGEIYSTRNPYSGRLLVEPDTQTKNGRGDICRTSYDSFRTFHKNAIIEILMDKYNMTYMTAERMTDTDFMLSDEQKVILNEILEMDDWWIIVNREPSIDNSAILAFEIAGLCDENILYINPIVCGQLRCDFDGDTFSVFVLPNPLKPRLKIILNPRAHSVWWNRTLNGSYNGVNDQVVLTHLILGENNVTLL